MGKNKEFKEDELWKTESLENEAREREHFRHLSANYTKAKKREERQAFEWE